MFLLFLFVVVPVADDNVVTVVVLVIIVGPRKLIAKFGQNRVSNTGCPTKPYPLCIWIIMNCKNIQFHYKTIDFKADLLRTKTNTHSFLRYIHV